ncbi:MAG: adenylosuccinate lyase [Acidimicrobiales bacterium]
MLSPLDGRYAAQVADLEAELSEEALFRRRFEVEVAWYRALAAHPAIPELPPLAPGVDAALDAWGPEDVAAIRAVEGVTNHDVKAVEYHLKDRLARLDVPEGRRELVHFGCTSEDVNNLAHALMLRDGLAKAWLPAAEGLVADVDAIARAHAATPMLAHTHGQPATPTTVGKEMAVFGARWRRQLDGVRALRLTGKFNGATGTYGAHVVAYPEVDWPELSRSFVEGLGLAWNPLTTQVEPHDSHGEVFHLLLRFDAILLDFCRDMWEYVSRGYLRQRPAPGEVGSSTMPHKVNPIDFENAEANVGLADALLGHLAGKLAVSRMQRDLSDSSALRNVGVAVGHSLLAVRAARRGLARVEVDAAALAADLDRHWEVLAEAVQTVMRRYGCPQPYERLKALTRGVDVGPAELRAIVSGLGLPPDAEARLAALTPATYTGLAAELVERYLDGGYQDERC